MKKVLQKDHLLSRFLTFSRSTWGPMGFSTKGDKNLLSVGLSIGDSGRVSQGRTRHILLEQSLATGEASSQTKGAAVEGVEAFRQIHRALQTATLG